ncbi:LacI family DNA-binding transcriptional regulator [Mumia flava]|uniref:LacI family DNA-binding transcriptional regulator n=1 Tax=Mumia flava TaxID=1348852 RepID=UPI001B8013D2|nr:LacI family DNA-binding transcriptional regulator [Mumia flava]
MGISTLDGEAARGTAGSRELKRIKKDRRGRMLCPAEPRTRREQDVPEPAAGGRARAGIADVAALAGVSQGTVSNVLNHPDRVAAKTRDKVRRAMDMLDYVPNGLARSLAAGSSQALGLVVSDLGNSVFVDIARGAEQTAESTGGTLLLANSDGRLEREASYLAVFAQSRVSGILITLNDAGHYAAISRIAPSGTPVVMLNHRADPGRFCSVSVDDELGGYLATRHLIETGRRRLVFVGGPDKLAPIQQRARGFRRAVAESGVSAIEVVPPWINRADGWRIGADLAGRVIDGDADGIVASTDLLAAGIVQSLAGRGDIQIPRDVAIIGYDNNQAAWDSPLPISTVMQPGHEMGSVGAAMVADEVEESGEHVHRCAVLSPKVLVRDSSMKIA